MMFTTQMRVRPLPGKVGRRRRIGTFSLLLGAALWWSASALSASDDAPVELDTYTLAAGETIWSVATDLTPAGKDVRDTVAEIKRVNHFSSASVQAGQQILIPALSN